eukprot:261601_1
MISILLYSLVLYICAAIDIDCTTLGTPDPCLSSGCVLMENGEGCTDPPETTSNPDTLYTCYCPNAGGNGQPWGDCECDGGAFTELRWKFEGTEVSDITIWNTDRPTVPGAAICEFTNVVQGQELTCLVDGNTFTEFPKNTYFSVTRSGATDVICDGTWHTSCSVDIIGQYGEPVKEGLNVMCPELVCTGWKDNGTPDADCDDGFDPCSCDTEPEPSTTATTGNEVTIATTSASTDTCYCENNGNGDPWGDCECDGGAFVELRWKYSGQETAQNIIIWNKERPDVSGDPLCEFTNVLPDQELTCAVDGTIATAFPKNTYFNIKRNDVDVCDGVWHTSCSVNILFAYGQASKEGLNTECQELMCTGWRDLGNPDTDCDDGFDPCPCTSPTTTIATTEAVTTTVEVTTTVAATTTSQTEGNLCYTYGAGDCIPNGCILEGEDCRAPTDGNDETTTTSGSDDATTTAGNADATTTAVACEIDKGDFKQAKLDGVDKKELHDICDVCLCEMQEDGSVGDECATVSQIESLLLSNDAEVIKIMNAFLEKCEDEIDCAIAQVRAKEDDEFECSCKGFYCADPLSSAAYQVNPVLCVVKSLVNR